MFGFFITTDIFSMFMYYEVAVIPMYLLIAIWGTGPKEYSAMKLTLMLMAGSALLIVALMGIYFATPEINGQHTFELLELAKSKIPIESQRFFFPFAFIGFGVLGALFPFHTWSPDGHAPCTYGRFYVTCGCINEVRGYGIYRVVMYLMPEAAQEQSVVLYNSYRY